MNKDTLLEKLKEYETNADNKELLKEIMQIAEKEDYRKLMSKDNYIL
jgi:hypothetical protein